MKSKIFYNYTIETAPSNLPVTLDEVETHLRITPDTEDTYLTFLINAVTNVFQNYTQRTLINTTFKAYLDYFCEDEILIKKSKLQSITSIKYYTDDVLTTWDSSNYYAPSQNDYSSLYLKSDGSFPTEIDEIKQAIEIIFIAGYGADNTSIPNDIKLALLNHIAFLYENRGDCNSEVCALPCPVRTIYNQYRILPMSYPGEC